MAGFTLVTGITGLIGAHVVSKLTSQSRKVVAIGRKRPDNAKIDELKQRGVVFVEGLFYDKDLLRSVFRRFPVDYVIHCAALRGGGAGTKEEYYRVNVSGTDALLRASLQGSVKRVVHLSSVGVMGTIPRELPGTLQTCFDGDNAYHESKLMAEEKVRECVAEGLDAYILRPTITYGKDDSGFPGKLVELVKKRRLLLPFHDIEIHLLHVETLADMAIRILDANYTLPRIFIVGDDGPIFLRELVDKIHTHYYGSGYPAYLRLPDIGYKIMLHGFRRLHNEKWMTRLLLLSRSWYYDVSSALQSGCFSPVKTRDEFVRVMCN